MKGFDAYNKIIPRAMQRQLDLQAKLSPTIISAVVNWQKIHNDLQTNLYPILVSAATNWQRINNDLQATLLPTYVSVFKNLQEINTALLPTYVSAFKHWQEINTALLPAYVSAAANWQIISNDLQNTLSSICSPLYQLHDFLNTLELKTCTVVKESGDSQTGFIANEIQAIQKCENIIDSYLNGPLRYLATNYKKIARKAVVLFIIAVATYVSNKALDYLWDYLFKKDPKSKQVFININNTFIINQNFEK